MKIPMQMGSQWVSKTITTSLTGADIELVVNEQAKLAIVTFNSINTASDGTFTLPNDVVPSRKIYAALRRDGFLQVSANDTTGEIANSRNYAVGELVFPIK